MQKAQLLETHGLALCQMVLLEGLSWLFGRLRRILLGDALIDSAAAVDGNVAYHVDKQLVVLLRSGEIVQEVPGRKECMENGAADYRASRYIR